MKQELPSATVRVGLSVAGYHGCAFILGMCLLFHENMSFGVTDPLPWIVLPQFYAACIWAAGGWLPALLIPAAVQARRWWICVAVGTVHAPLVLLADSKWFAGNLLPKASDPALVPILGWAAAYSCAGYLLYALGFALLARRKTAVPEKDAAELERLPLS